MAVRLSTGGKEVLDGKGLAVSVGRGVTVKVSVGVEEEASVAVGARAVFVAGKKEVFVGTLVSTGVDGAGVEVRVHAKELIIPRIKKIRLISQIESPSRIIYPNQPEVTRIP